MTYIEKLATEAGKAAEILLAKKVDEKHRSFSSDPAEIPAKIWAPAQAMTKFQMEQSLGDWAEDRVLSAINLSDDYKAIAFGDNDKTLSQDDKFSEIYRAGKIRELKFGKRSDLLLFKKAITTPDKATDLTPEDAELLCAGCDAAIEVRSSRTSALIFIEHCQKLKAANKKPARMEPSFTVKVEDLSKVYRWMARNGKPVIYTQVFFDTVYALNFMEVFHYINKCGSKLKLENPARSGKYTIMIPISVGTQVGTVVPPDFEVVSTLHDNGRHDVYAKPINGKINIQIDKLAAVI